MPAIFIEFLSYTKGSNLLGFFHSGGTSTAESQLATRFSEFFSAVTPFHLIPYSPKQKHKSINRITRQLLAGFANAVYFTRLITLEGFLLNHTLRV